MYGKTSGRKSCDCDRIRAGDRQRHRCRPGQEGAKVLTNNRKPKGYSASQFRREDMPEEDWKELCRLL